jgi:hypothetical protein
LKRGILNLRFIKEEITFLDSEKGNILLMIVGRIVLIITRFGKTNTTQMTV